MNRFSFLTMVGLLAVLASSACAQPPGGGARPPQFDSPEIGDDGSVTFRIHAPEAENVRLASSDLPSQGNGLQCEKDDQGVWSVTVESVDSGAYRYLFQVDGVPTVDPRNRSSSESNSNLFSLVYVPGTEFMDTQEVPHGAVAEVHYHSSSLDRDRRMHVYTPPGYEAGDESYPVFYLLHGATDCDDSWTTVGRANFILDNLIASEKAQPMIVVMPHGHTGAFRFGPGQNSFSRQMEEFSQDFVSDIRPYIEEHYRTIDDRDHRAIAGLSMGGAQTLNVAFPNLGDYGYIGVFSSGIFGITGGPGGQQGPSWEESHAEMLDNADLKEGLRMVWFGIGKEDFLLDTSNATVAMLKDHGFDIVEHQTDGGHTWANWRNYLNEMAPLLFQEE